MTLGYLPASSHHPQLVSEAILIHMGQSAKANLTTDDLIAILLLAWVFSQLSVEMKLRQL